MEKCPLKQPFRPIKHKRRLFFFCPTRFEIATTSDQSIVQKALRFNFVCCLRPFLLPHLCNLLNGINFNGCWLRKPNFRSLVKLIPLTKMKVVI